MAARIVVGLDLLEQHPGQLAPLMGELLRHQPIEDRDAFMRRVLLLPGRSLHLIEAAAHDDRDLLAAEAPRRAAAIHCRVAAAEDDDAAADLVDMAERDAGEPVDADMDVGRRFLAAGNVEIAPAWRAAADKHGIPTLGEQFLQARGEFSETGLDPHVEDQIDLLVGNRFRQPETRNLRPHHAAALHVAVEHHAVIAERHQIARDGQGCRPGADKRDPLAVLLARDGGQVGADIALVVGRDALQPADRHRLLLDPAAPAGRLARPVTSATEDAGEDIRFPIHHERVGIAPISDQPDVFRHRRMRRTRPLAIDDLVKIIRVTDVGRLH